MAIHETPAGEVRRNIEYSRPGGQSLHFDALLPHGAGPFSAAIIVHGGGWIGGDRRYGVEPLFEPLLQAGIACISISYRLVTQISTFGTAIEDVEQAIRYVSAHAAEFTIQPDRIVLAGGSAGGQLAAMAAMGKSGPGLRAVVSLFAPMDLEILARQSSVIPESFRQSLAGTPFAEIILARLRELSPVRHVRSGLPPFLLIHGTADALVPFEQSRNMCRMMRQAGGECDLIAVKGGGHGLRAWEAAGLTTYKRLMIGWLRKQIG